MEHKAKEVLKINNYVDSQGRINERKLFSYLNCDTQKERFKSVTNSSAQTESLCASRSQDEVDYSRMLSKIESILQHDRTLYYIAMLQLCGGLRISEVLGIRPYDITLTGHVSIHSRKGSSHQIIHGGVVANYLIQCKKLNMYPFNLYSRYYVYRQYKKYGLTIQPVNSSKKAVTHSLRHLAASAQRNESIQDEKIQKFLRHVSSKSTTYYGKNSKK